MTRDPYSFPELKSLDTNETIRKLLSAAESGNAEAQRMLAKAFETGAGVDRDVSQALYWYARAVDTLLKKGA